MSFLEGLAQLLHDNGVGTYDPSGAAYGLGPAIFIVGVPPNPDAAIILSPYPGPEGGGEDSRNPWTEPRLQVRTRATTDPRAALALDASVWQVLHPLGPLTLPDGTKLQDCYSLQSAPLALGQDALGRWEWTRNYQITLDS